MKEKKIVMTNIPTSEKIRELTIHEQLFVQLFNKNNWYSLPNVHPITTLRSIPNPQGLDLAEEMLSIDRYFIDLHNKDQMNKIWRGDNWVTGLTNWLKNARRTKKNYAVPIGTGIRKPVEPKITGCRFMDTHDYNHNYQFDQWLSLLKEGLPPSETRPEKLTLGFHRSTFNKLLEKKLLNIYSKLQNNDLWFNFAIFLKSKNAHMVGYRVYEMTLQDWKPTFDHSEEEDSEEESEEIVVHGPPVQLVNVNQELQKIIKFDPDNLLTRREWSALLAEHRQKYKKKFGE